MSELSDQIATDATKPQATSADGVSIQRRTLTEQIAADKYGRDIAATESPAALFRGMNCKIVPPGGR